MTRQKKSRSAGPNGLRHLNAEDARKTREPKAQTKKKGAGLKSGNRNNVATTKPENTSNSTKDKRLGSKTPISLLPATETSSKEQLPRASLSKAKPIPLAPEVELAAIENDTYLQQLLEKVEQDEQLTGKDAKYFNAKTKRLTELLAELGLDQEQENEPEDLLSAFEQKDWRKDLLGDD